MLTPRTLQETLRQRDHLGELQIPPVVLQVSAWAVKRRYFARRESRSGVAVPTLSCPPISPIPLMRSQLAATEAATAAVAAALAEAGSSDLPQPCESPCSRAPRSQRARRSSGWSTLFV